MTRAILIVFCSAMLAFASTAVAEEKGVATIPQPQTQHALEASLKEIATAIDRGLPSNTDATECTPGHAERSRELCAQWTAADAAKESAEAAFLFGTLGFGLGMLTLLAAGFAAVFAGKAATYTKHAAQSDRAWMSYTQSYVGPFTGSIAGTPVNDGMAVQIEFKNIGHTPAKIHIFESGYGVIGYDELPPEVLTTEHENSAALVPNGQRLAPGRYLNDDETRRFRAKEVAIWFYVRIEYEDIYSSAAKPVLRVTECCMRVRHSGGFRNQIEDVAFQPLGLRNRMT